MTNDKAQSLVEVWQCKEHIFLTTSPEVWVKVARPSCKSQLQFQMKMQVSNTSRRCATKCEQTVRELHILYLYSSQIHTNCKETPKCVL